MRQDGSYKTQRPNMIQIRRLTQEGIINNVLACSSSVPACDTGSTTTTTAAVVTSLPQGISPQISQLYPSLRASLTTPTVNTSQSTVGLMAASNVTSSSHVQHTHSNNHTNNNNNNQVRQILVSNSVDLPKVTDGLVSLIDARQQQQQHLQLLSQSHSQQQQQQQQQHHLNQQQLLQHHQSSYPTPLQTIDINSESVSVQVSVAPSVITSQNILLNTSTVSSNGQQNVNCVTVPITQEQQQQQLQQQAQTQAQISLTQSQLLEILGIDRVCATPRIVVTEGQQHNALHHHQQQQQISQLQQQQHNLHQQQILSNNSTNVNVTECNSQIQNSLRDSLLSSAIDSSSSNLVLTSSLVSPMVSHPSTFHIGHSEKLKKQSGKPSLIDSNTMLNKLLDTTKVAPPIKPRPDLVHQVPNVTVKPLISSSLQNNNNSNISNTNRNVNNISANNISICESNNLHKMINPTQVNSRNTSNNISTISLPRPVNSLLSDNIDNVSATLNSNIDHLGILGSNFSLNSNSLAHNQSQQLSQRQQFETLQQVLLGSGSTGQLTDAQINSAAADTMRIIASLSDIAGSDNVLATIAQLNENKGAKKFAASANGNNRVFSNVEPSVKPAQSRDISRNSAEAHNKVTLISSSDPMFPLPIISSSCSSPSSLASFGSTATRVVSQQDTNTKVRAMLADPKVSQLSLAELLNKGHGPDSLLASSSGLPIMSLRETGHTGDVLLSELHRSDESDLSLGASLNGNTGEDLPPDNLVTEASLGNTISGETNPLQGLPSPPLHTFSLPNMSSDFMVSGVSGGKNLLPGPLPALLSNLATTSDLDQFQFLDHSNMGIDMSSLSESEVSLSNVPSGFPLSPGKSVQTKKPCTNSSSELNFTNALKAAKSDTEQVRTKLELESGSSNGNDVPLAHEILKNMQLKSELTEKQTVVCEKNSIIDSVPQVKESRSQTKEIIPPSRKSSQTLPKITKNLKNSKQSGVREKKKREKQIKNELLVQQVACFKCRLCSFLSQDNGEMLNHMKFNHSVEMSDSEGESDESSLSPDSKRLCRTNTMETKGPKDILFGPPSTRKGINDLDSSDDALSSTVVSTRRSKKNHVVEDPEYKLDSFMLEPQVFKKQAVKIEKEETGFGMLLQEEIEEKAHVKVFVETYNDLRNLGDQNGYDEDEDTNDSSTTNDSNSTIPSIPAIGFSGPQNSKSMGKLIKTEGKGSRSIGIKCDIAGCGLRMKSEVNINYHRKCHKERMLQCPECRTNFGVWRDLSIHLWRQHCIDMELHKCDLCNYKSYSLSKLMNIHYKVHSDERPSLCETCGKRFKTAKQLRNHKALHIRKNEIPALMCDTCQRPFMDRRMLRNHMESVHKKVKPFLCNFCGYSTASKSTLKMHMRQHTGEKPFACGQCTYRTADHNSLRRHKMQHTGVRPYQCPYCSYASIQSSTFKVHLKDKHPGLAQMDGIMFQCGLCNFKTVKRDNYLAHVAEHNKAESKKQRQLAQQQQQQQQANESKQNNEQGVSLQGEAVPTAHVVNIDVNSGAVTVETPRKHQHQFINSTLVQGQLPSQVVLSGGEQYIYATVDSSMLSQVSSGASEGLVHLSPSVVAVPMTMSVQASGTPQTLLPNIVYVTSTNQDPDDPSPSIGM